ncbi:uncharacterized protein CTRU02_201416 [Colletotrichum truncatum]|uniref:Uncharacterized protein n=1 Tax=Colletotrichum truncatum TaxID=5467 RepID=A0ACC3ZH82_COLTU|nr:uncharacterized protein CTRU02_15474 [Colletotrichum truncatum]KAF6781006.1 hypothetical protein CTRU02_15474 [Colletotrichum truncatum]
MSSGSHDSPTFQETIAMLQGIGPSSIPEEWEFGLCQGRNKDEKASRCRLSGQDPERTKQLCNILILMKQNIATQEFFDQLHVFVTISHCGDHVDISRKIVEEWREKCITDGGKFTNECCNVTDHDSGNDRTSIRGNSTTENGLCEPTNPMQLERMNEVKHDGNSHVETIVDGISTMDLTSTNQTNHTSQISEVRNNSPEYIFRLGLASLKRSNSLRNDSPIFTEIYKPLTQTQKKDGILYVVELDAEKGWYKIGWTTKTIDGLSHKCSLESNAKVVYKSPGGPFFAADKAKKLALAALHDNKIHISPCDDCGSRHREWIGATRERVIETVKSMETFVQLPAYKPMDGDNWKLSETAAELVGRMCRFSLSELESATTITETPPLDDTATSFMTPQKQGTTIIVDGIDTPQSSQDSFEVAYDKSPPSPTEVKTGKSKRTSMGSIIKRGIIKTSNVYNYFRHSQEETAETDRSDKTKDWGSGDRRGSETKEEKAILDIFWSMFPEKITTEKGDVHNKGSRPSSWFKRHFWKFWRTSPNSTT